MSRPRRTYVLKSDMNHQGKLAIWRWVQRRSRPRRVYPRRRSTKVSLSWLCLSCAWAGNGSSDELSLKSCVCQQPLVWRQLLASTYIISLVNIIEPDYNIEFFPSYRCLLHLCFLHIPGTYLGTWKYNTWTIASSVVSSGVFAFYFLGFVLLSTLLPSHLTDVQSPLN